MGCANGSCGVRPAVSRNAGCGVCDQDRYRLAMRGMLNPWATVNAGKILPGGGSTSYQGGDTSYDYGDKGGGGGSSGSSNQGAYDVATTTITEIGQTARAQIDADARRATVEAQARADARAREDALARQDRDTSSRQYRTETTTTGGGGGMLLLALLAAGAAVMTGAVKLPRKL